MTALRKVSTWLAIAATGAVVAFILLVVPNYRIYIIHTGSMTGTIPIGSAVIDRVGDDVHVGEVITFHRPVDGQLVTHRLIQIQSNGWLVTKGDANPTPDLGSIPRTNVVGHVVAAPQHIGIWLHFMFHERVGYLFDALVVLVMYLALSVGGTKNKKKVGGHRAQPAAKSHRRSPRAAPPASSPPADMQDTTNLGDLRGLFEDASV